MSNKTVEISTFRKSVYLLNDKLTRNQIYFKLPLQLNVLSRWATDEYTKNNSGINFRVSVYPQNFAKRKEI